MKVAVMIPTYNERGNIGPLLDKIVSLSIRELQVIVVDDDSPDGTWEIVRDRMKNNPGIRLLRRMENRGRGLAGAAGFKYALEIGADCVIEMDGDFSHDPSYIPDFVRTIRDYDVVLGSRFVAGGDSEGRGFVRKIISRFAGAYMRLVLGFRMNDPTSGYRCFRKEVLEKIDLSGLKAVGPFIVTAVLYRCHKMGFRIGEIPIVFKERESGSSKLGLKVLFKNLFGVLRLRFRE